MAVVMALAFATQLVVRVVELGVPQVLSPENLILLISHLPFRFSNVYTRTCLQGKILLLQCNKHLRKQYLHPYVARPLYLAYLEGTLGIMLVASSILHHKIRCKTWCPSCSKWLHAGFLWTFPIWINTSSIHSANALCARCLLHWFQDAARDIQGQDICGHHLHLFDSRLRCENQL